MPTSDHHMGVFVLHPVHGCQQMQPGEQAKVQERAHKHLATRRRLLLHDGVIEGEDTICTNVLLRRTFTGLSYTSSPKIAMCSEQFSQSSRGTRRRGPSGVLDKNKGMVIRYLAPCRSLDYSRKKEPTPSNGGSTHLLSPLRRHVVWSVTNAFANLKPKPLELTSGNASYDIRSLQPSRQHKDSRTSLLIQRDHIVSSGMARGPQPVLSYLPCPLKDLKLDLIWLRNALSLNFSQWWCRRGMFRCRLMARGCSRRDTSQGSIIIVWRHLRT